MRILWNHISIRREYPCRIFIALWTLFWTVPFAAVSLAVCMGMGLPMFEVIRYTCLVAGYPGIIIGFFGSFIFAMRKR
ncbi:MAG: hypothetical protein LUC41_02230 [Clostridiales bacterium]|nr:hypothetical protein [Clostridiales bacterium]